MLSGIGASPVTPAPSPRARRTSGLAWPGATPRTTSSPRYGCHRTPRPSGPPARGQSPGPLDILQLGDHPEDVVQRVAERAALAVHRIGIGVQLLAALTCSVHIHRRHRR